MANVAWPDQDFSLASNTDVLMPGFTRSNLARFWPVNSVRCARMHALASGSTNTLPATADSMMVLPDPVGATASVFP